MTCNEFTTTVMLTEERDLLASELMACFGHLDSCQRCYAACASDLLEVLDDPSLTEIVAKGKDRDLATLSRGSGDPELRS